MPYQRTCHLFFIFKLAVNSFIWKKILSLTLFKTITVSRSSILLRVFLQGRPGCPTKKKNWGNLPASQKVWIFPICWISPLAKKWVHLSPDRRSHIGKKGFNSFYTDFTKNSAEACIFSNTIMTYLKKLIGTKFQQDHLPELFPIVLLSILWETLEMGESHPTAKNVLIYPTRKIPLMKFTLLSKVSFILHEIVVFI